jgi:membrane associated rhomboid family serine protease
MRLIASFEDPLKARKFYSLLISKEIEALYEIEGSSFKVWIYEEGDYPKAEQILAQFEKEGGGFDQLSDVHLADFKEAPKEISDDPIFLAHVHEMRKKLSAKTLYANIEPSVTKVTIFLCAILFFITFYQHYGNEDKFSPIEQGLLYDSLSEVNALLSLEPTEEERLVLEAKSENVFIGYYYIALNWPLSKAVLDAPKFVKIRQGEVWRLVTPALLHGSVLHILFNMMWLWLLGRQIEERVGKWRYILMMLIIAAISNTAEYLMVGPAFLGFSGVICGQAGFIWMRQRVAPWEGYPLQKSASLFLAIFVLGIVGLQVISFVLKVTGSALLPVQIANTAHLVGAIVGILLAKTELFARHSHP